MCMVFDKKIRKQKTTNLHKIEDEVHVVLVVVREFESDHERRIERRQQIAFGNYALHGILLSVRVCVYSQHRQGRKNTKKKRYQEKKRKIEDMVGFVSMKIQRAKHAVLQIQT